MDPYFYIGTDGQQKGPIYPDEFMAYGVNNDTMVWRSGMTDWTKAGDVYELLPYFATPIATPPETPNVPPPYTPRQSNETCPDNYLVWAILTTLFCCWPFSIPAIVNASKVDRLWALGNKAEAIEKAKNAKKWCWVSFFAAIAWWVLYAIIIIVCIAAEVAIFDELYW